MRVLHKPAAHCHFLHVDALCQQLLCMLHPDLTQVPVERSPEFPVEKPTQIRFMDSDLRCNGPKCQWPVKITQHNIQGLLHRF